MRKPPLHYSLIWHTWLFSWICGLLAAVYPLPACAALCLLVWADKRLQNAANLVNLFAIALAGFIFSTWSFQVANTQKAFTPNWLAAKPDKTPLRVCGVVNHVQGLPDNRLRILLAEVRPQNASLDPMPGYCALTWQQASFEPIPGQTLCISRRLYKQDSFANSEINSWEISALAKKIYWRIWSKGNDGDPQIHGKPDFFAQSRMNLKERFLKILFPENEEAMAAPNQGKAILVALLFGDRQFLTRQTVNLFVWATLAHSLALSGQHLCVAAFLGFLLAFAISRIRPEIYLKIPKMMLIALASLPFAMAYLWIGNAPASLLRAFGMLAFGALLLWRGRPFGGLDLLCATLLAILIWQPLAIFDFGLQLSALCIGIIILATSPLSKLRFAFRQRKWAARVIQILLISVIIQLALLPLSLINFQIAGIWFFLNLVWLPILGLAVLPLAATGLILAACPWHFCNLIAALCLKLAAWPCSALLDLLLWLHNAHLLEEPPFLLPHWSSLLAFTCLAIGLGWYFGNLRSPKILRKSRKFMTVALVFLAVGPLLRLHTYFDSSITVEALDVGQGEALLLKFPHDGRILLDGGGLLSSGFDTGKNVLSPLLTANHAPTLDAIINSHPDLDHFKGLIYFLKNFQFANFFHNDHSCDNILKNAWISAQADKRSHKLAYGDEIILGNPENKLKLQVLHPDAHSDPDSMSSNGASLILRLTWKDKGLILFTGDAEKETLQKIGASTDDLSARVVVAPHHGSNKSVHADFYKLTKPELVIACCGRNNRWHYPGQILKDLLARYHIPLLDTGNCGRIKIDFTKDLEIQTIRKFSMAGNADNIQ